LNRRQRQQAWGIGAYLSSHAHDRNRISSYSPGLDCLRKRLRQRVSMPFQEKKRELGPFAGRSRGTASADWAGPGISPTSRRAAAFFGLHLEMTDGGSSACDSFSASLLECFLQLLRCQPIEKASTHPSLIESSRVGDLPRKVLLEIIEQSCGFVRTSRPAAVSRSPSSPTGILAPTTRGRIESSLQSSRIAKRACRSQDRFCVPVACHGAFGLANIEID